MTFTKQQFADEAKLTDEIHWLTTGGDALSVYDDKVMNLIERLDFHAITEALELAMIAHVVPDQHGQETNNARLIAAAPDLLKCLQECVQALDDIDYFITASDRNTTRQKEAVRQALTAIAKATEG